MNSSTMSSVINWSQKWADCSKTGTVHWLLPDIQNEFSKSPNGPLAVVTLIHMARFLQQHKTNQKANSVDSNALYDITILCCQNLQPELKEFQALRFLPTIFHVVQYFIDNGMADKALNIREYIVLALKTAECLEVNDKLVDYCCALFRLYKNLATSVYKKYLVNGISGEYLQALSILRGNFDLLAYTKSSELMALVNYVTTLPPLNSEVNASCRKELVCLQLQVLALPSGIRFCDDQSQTMNEDFFKKYFHLICDIILSCVTMNDYEKARHILMDGNAMESMISSNNILQPLAFAKMFLLLILYPMGTKVIHSPKSILKMNNIPGTLDSIIKLQNKSDVLPRVLHAMYPVIDLLHLKWIEASLTDWNLTMNIDVLTSLFKVLQRIAQVFETICVSVCKKSNCNVKTDAHLTVEVNIIMLGLTKKAVMCDTMNAGTLLKPAKEAQQSAFGLCKSMKLGECPKWQLLWNRTAIVSYNLAYYCQTEHWHDSNKLFSTLCQFITQLEDANQPILSKIGLWDLFKGILQNYRNLKQRENALLTLCAALAVIPANKEAIFDRWISTKSDPRFGCDDALLMESTMWDTLNNKSAMIKTMYPFTKFDELNNSEVDLWELQAYNKSRNKPNDAALKTIVCRIQNIIAQSNLSPVTHGSMMNILLESVCKQEDSGYIEKTLQSCRKTIDGMVAWPARGDRNVLCAQAGICFMQFLCIKEITEAKAKAAFKIRPLVTTTVGGDIEVTSSYYNLDRRTEEVLLQNLDEAVALCRSSLIGVELLEKHHVEQLKRILENSALHFMVYGYDARAFQSWALLYKLGESVKDSSICILAVTNLLPSLEYRRADKLISTVDSMVKDLSGQDEVAARPFLIPYWLSKSRSCLHSGEYTKGKEWLKTATESIKLIQAPETSLLYADAMLVTSQYLSLPSIVDGNLEHLSTYEAAIAAHASISSTMRRIETTEGNEVNLKALNIAISTAVWLTELCLRQKWIKPLLTYATLQLERIQQLALATRTAQVLSLLAQRDLILWKLADCSVKLASLGSILVLNERSKNTNTIYHPQSDNFTIKVKEEIQETDCDFPNTMRLQLPPRNTSPRGSPLLLPVPFKQPDFINHTCTCQCWHCSDPLIQNLALHVTHIQALYYWLQSDLKQALSFLRGAMFLAGSVEKMQARLFDILESEVAGWPMGCLKLGKALCSNHHKSKANAVLCKSLYYISTSQLNKASEAHKYLTTCLTKGFIVAFSSTQDAVWVELSLMQIKCDQATESKEINLNSQLQALSIGKSECGINARAMKENIKPHRVNVDVVCTPVANSLGIHGAVNVINSVVQQDVGSPWFPIVSPVAKRKLNLSPNKDETVPKTPANSQHGAESSTKPTKGKSRVKKPIDHTNPTPKCTESPVLPNKVPCPCSEQKKSRPKIVPPEDSLQQGFTGGSAVDVIVIPKHNYIKTELCTSDDPDHQVALNSVMKAPDVKNPKKSVKVPKSVGDAGKKLSRKQKPVDSQQQMDPSSNTETPSAQTEREVKSFASSKGIVDNCPPRKQTVRSQLKTVAKQSTPKAPFKVLDEMNPRNPNEIVSHKNDDIIETSLVEQKATRSCRKMLSSDSSETETPVGRIKRCVKTTVTSKENMENCHPTTRSNQLLTSVKKSTTKTPLNVVDGIKLKKLNEMSPIKVGDIVEATLCEQKVTRSRRKILSSDTNVRETQVDGHTRRCPRAILENLQICSPRKQIEKSKPTNVKKTTENPAVNKECVQAKVKFSGEEKGSSTPGFFNVPIKLSTRSTRRK